MRRGLRIGLLIGGIAVAVGLWQLSRAKTSPSIDRPALASPSARPAPVAANPPLPRLAPSPVPPEDRPAATHPAANEKSLLLEIRALVKTNPARAEALARQSRARFPDGDSADERDALLVDALINQEHIGAARDETYAYARRHPDGRFSQHLFNMTGVHPTPSGPGR